MKKFFIFVFLFCLLGQTVLQQILIQPSIMLAPQVAEQYSIVHTFLYPSSSQFATKLDRDHYIKKWKKESQSNPSFVQPTPPKPASTSTSSSILFESIPKQIPVITRQGSPVPKIQDNYHVVKIIYPFAQIEEPKIQNPKIQIYFDKASVQSPQDNLIGKEKELNNDNKVIEWKVKNPPTLRDYVVENGNDISLTKMIKASEAGTAQIQSEENMPKTPTLPVQAIIDSPITIQNRSSNQDHHVQVQPTLTRDYQINGQIQKLRFKNHKQTLIFLFIALAVLLCIFFYLKWGKSKVQFWKKLNKKLQNYRSNASYVAPDEQEQVMGNKDTGLIQDGHD